MNLPGRTGFAVPGLSAELDQRFESGPSGSAARGNGDVVEAGRERLRIERWQVRGNRAVSTERILSGLPANLPLDEKTIARVSARILGLYEAQGYPLAVLRLRSVEPVGPGLCVVTLGIEEGEPVEVRKLEFVGAGPVSQRVLTRTARFFPGRWQPRRVEAWQRNLDASGLVRVESRELLTATDGYALRFHTRPERANRISGAVGYDAAEAELSGFAFLALRNIANTGRNLRVVWSSYRERGRYELDYTEPWLFGSRLSLEALARHQSLDTTAGRTELGLSAVLPATPEMELQLGSGYEQMSGVDPGYRARIVWGSTGIVFDTRTPRVNPGKGVAFGIRTRAGTRQGEDASGFIGRVEADFGLVGPRLGRLTFENRVQARMVESPAALSELELYRIGGAATVRGHREEAFSARRLGWLNSELRYPIERNSAVYLFFDLGAVLSAEGRRFPLGYGAGSRVGTRIGAFTAAYGLAPGTRPLSGKVHFQYEGEF